MGSRRASLSGLATMLGGALFVLFGIVYSVFTHGSTSADRHQLLFGLDGVDYCRMQVVWPLLLLVGLSALQSLPGGRDGRLESRGFITAALALVGLSISFVLQCWLADPDREFGSARVQIGFLLGVLAQVLLAGGMVAFGSAAVQTRVLARWRWLPLVIGVLHVLTLLLEGEVLGHYSTGSRLWDLVQAATRVPLGVAWMLLGYVLWRGRSAAPPPVSADGADTR